MKFKDYNINKAIKDQLDEMGFVRATDIQYKAIKHILDGEDVMAIAQTGTGKTAAFAIPMLHFLSQKSKYSKGFVQCLVMVPTRELAQQIANVFKEIGKKTTVKVLGLFGGVEQDTQIQQLTSGIDILVATPGRMFDLIAQGHLNVDEVRYLILDEADLMLSKGFNKDIQDILKKIPKKRQTLFFSATIDKKIKSLAYDVVKNAIRIQISPKNPVAQTVEHAVAFIEMDDKRFFLENILSEYPDKRILVFVRTKVRAGRVVAAMKRVGIDSEEIHGGVEQKERFSILERFRKGENLVLITTDVSARGIDIPNVDYVINYDIPDDPENYVHRCGRTGRGEKKGQAISFCSDSEKQLLADIEEYTGEEIMHYDIHPDDYKEILEDTDDLTYNWQKLIDKDNLENGTEEKW
ncbi:MAG: DEAD/DEAH box helicase [Crocinitomicaceae bacterium]|nr:DEAD/DEAH box helicase [Crocinitomicaceae bacterium]